MWMLVSFDLPSGSSEQQRDYRAFRKQMLAAGFMMMHESLYFRWYETDDKVKTAFFRMKSILPKEGNVAFISLTDIQFGSIAAFRDANSIQLPVPPPPFVCF